MVKRILGLVVALGFMTSMVVAIQPPPKRDSGKAGAALIDPPGNGNQGDLPRLGIRMDYTDDGVYIRSVDANSPARRAVYVRNGQGYRLDPGDYIREIAGVRIRSAADWRRAMNRVADAGEGSWVKMQIWDCDAEEWVYIRTRFIFP